MAAYDFSRFVAAQDPVIDAVLAELRQGRKTSHWMWFVFPQIAGLGQSDMARRFALGSLEEARAYLGDDVLGTRLREAVRLVCAVKGRSAHTIFGSPDDVKFRSSMTLFAEAMPQETIFQAALDQYFDGERDPLTIAKLA
jgi:uncharacterized protein (DUF1810 family)